MGEYALYKGRQIKIGTCETMYIRYQDRVKVQPLSGNVDPGKDTGLFWLLPYSEDDSLEPGDNYPNRQCHLMQKDKDGHWQAWLPDDYTSMKPGRFQMSHPSGLLVDVNCYHGAKLPSVSQDFMAFWNGKDGFPFSLCAVKNMPDGKIRGVIECRFCHEMWSDDLAVYLPFVHDAELRRRLEAMLEPEPQPEPQPEPEPGPQQPIEPQRPAMPVLKPVPMPQANGTTYEKNGVVYRIGDRVVYNHIHSFCNEFNGVIVSFRNCKNGMRVAIRDGKEIVRCSAYSIIRKGEDAKGVDMYYN